MIYSFYNLVIVLLVLGLVVCVGLLGWVLMQDAHDDTDSPVKSEEAETNESRRHVYQPERIYSSAKHD